jgi:ankyrin repeat protein
MKLISRMVLAIVLLVSLRASGEVEWPPKKTPAWREFQRLIRAVDRNDIRTVRAMVMRGADIDGKHAGDDFVPAERPLLRASRNGNLVIVNLLLKAGAMPDWCCCSCVTALHEAIRHGHADIVKRLLTAGSDPKIPYDGETPTLELAKATGDPAIVALVTSSLEGS